MTSAIEKQRSGPPSCTDPQADTGVLWGLSPPPTDPPEPRASEQGTHGLASGSCLTLLGLKGSVTLTPGLPTELGFPNADANVNQMLTGRQGRPGPRTRQGYIAETHGLVDALDG